jgi:hypothetical protein
MEMNVCEIVVEKVERKRLLGRHRCRWEGSRMFAFCERQEIS